MDSINEVQVLTNIRLSQAQKYILAKLVLPNSTPLTSYEEISSGKNIVANRDILIKLEMLKLGANEAEITDKGINALKNENLVDNNNSLTQQGEQYAYATSLEDIEKIAAQEQKEPQKPAPELGNTAETPVGGPQQPTEIAREQDPGGPALESWAMISDIHNEFIKKQFIKKYLK